MARSSRIIIIFVVITLILGIGCLFLIDFSGDAQNLQNAQKNTVTEVENDAPGNKKVEADRWSVIEGRLSIFSDTELKKKSKLVVPAVYEGSCQKIQRADSDSSVPFPIQPSAKYYMSSYFLLCQVHCCTGSQSSSPYLINLLLLYYHHKKHFLNHLLPDTASVTNSLNQTTLCHCLPYRNF